MKIVILIARILLGLTFVVFGLNGFLHFLPAPPSPGLAGEYMSVMIRSGYFAFIFLLQLIGGLLLLAGVFVPLGLVILAPIIVNILLFHILLAPQGLPIALLVVVLWLVVAHSQRSAFLPLLRR